MTWKRKSKFRQYSPLDLSIRKTLNGGMEDGILMKIEFVYGFELFGAYENWRGGYKVSGRGQTYTAEYLEDAINGWSKKVEEAADPNKKPWESRSYMGMIEDKR